MPSIFEISVAAFAIGMATNANAPNNAPKAEVTVQQPVTDATAPAPKQADVAAADCVAKQTDTKPVCAQDSAQ